ncbi:MAG: AAA family ATPase [Gammaproteobacteria bacterium]|nr:AAA family ATPase [Gammaproteobacteria bacterium]
MRIVDLSIERWRNFRNISLEVPEESTLVCLIGENGTGKSNILELISAAANRLGISPGIEIPRGDPLSEEHSFSLGIKLSEGLPQFLAPERVQQFTDEGVIWDGIVRFVSSRGTDGTQNEFIIAGGSGDEHFRLDLANHIRHSLQQNKETNYLSLDADRAYPPLQIHPQHYAETLARDWEEPVFRKQRAFVPTRTVYDEWVKHFLARETQDATRLQRKMRQALYQL